MAVYKDEKTNTWRVLYRYTDWNGERKQSQKRGFQTKREAQAWEREQLRKAGNDLDMSFKSFVEHYTEDMQSRLKENTWAISKRRVQLLCEQGRINGANMVSGVWLIPSTAQKPDDARKKRKILDNQFSLFGVRDTAYGERISLDQVCEILSISTATAKNWIRLGKLTVEEGGKSFDKKYIEELALEIKNGDDTRLKSRRNKKCLSGNSLYKEYIQNDCNQKTVETILKKCEVLSEEELRVILSFFATQLYCQSRNLVFSKDRFRNANSFPKDLTFSSLRADLLNGIDLARFDYANIEFIFDLSLSFVPTEDTLGFVYISLRDLSKRKQTGAYFTPAKTVRTLISSLLDVCPYHEDSRSLIKIIELV